MKLSRFPTIACIGLLFFIVASSPPVLAVEHPPTTREVEVRVFLIDIDSIDNVSQSFVANVYFEMRWHDRTLAHDGTVDVTLPLSDLWHPRLQIINQQRLLKTFPEIADVSSSGVVTHRQRVWGSFSQPLDLANFPFDSQKLEIIWVASGFSPDEVRLLASDRSALSERLTIPDWSVEGWELRSFDLPLGQGDRGTLPAMVLTLGVERHTGYFIIKVIFPLVLIVMMSWLVYWIDPVDFGPQVSVAITTILTLIAYRFAIGAMVPPLSFLTSLDYFILGSTVLVFLGLVEVIVTSRYLRNGRVELARSIDRHARWIAPLVYLLIAAEALYFRFWL